MEKKPFKPSPIPIPKPPKKPCHPMKPMKPTPPPMHHMYPYPCIPCDEKMIHHLRKHLKMCHRHEMEIINMMMKYCKKHTRNPHDSPRNPWDSPRDRWDSPYYDDSPRYRKTCHSCESSRYRRPYESSSFRN